MSQTLSVSDAMIGRYTLSVTTRDCGDTPEMMEELTYRTIKAWLWISSKLEAGEYTLPLTAEGDMLGSVEQRLSNEFIDHDASMFPDVEGDARVTVWDTFKSTNRIGFHLNSSDIPQIAVNTWVANHKAIDRIRQENSQSATQTAQEAVSAAAANQQVDKPATPRGTTEMPNSPPVATEGAIVATRAPNSNRPDYANGQLVSFTVTKIVASSNKGSAVFQMWTPLGTQYPTISIYKLKPDGNLKPDYEAIVPVLNTLNLSLDKPEAVGTWRLVCRAAHVEDKKTQADREFLNVVSLTPI